MKIDIEERESYRRPMATDIPVFLKKIKVCCFDRCAFSSFSFSVQSFRSFSLIEIDRRFSLCAYIFPRIRHTFSSEKHSPVNVQRFFS